MTARFADLAGTLHAAGYNPIPITPRDKAPAIKAWTEYVYDDTDAGKFPQAGVGLLCGELRGIDIDVRNEEVSARICSLAADMLWPGGKAPRRIGQWPKALFMVRSESGPKMSTAPYKLDSDTFDNDPHKVEILGKGQQFVAYGIHPKTGREYEWNGAGDPVTVPFASLPFVSAERLREFLEAVETVLEEFGTRCGKLMRDESGKVHKPAGELRGDYQTVANALAHIRNDNLSRDDWILMGHAIKGALGEAGRDLWITWSQSSGKSGKSGASDTPAKAWESFQPTRIGAGTIYYEASRNGWKRPAKAATALPEGWDDVPPLGGTSPERPTHTSRADGHSWDKAPRRSLILVNGADVKPEPIAWLWDGWLAAGKLHILAGAPGTGKTTIAMALAATVSLGGRWPDGMRSEAGGVVIASYEDGTADTIAPRLIAAGAEMARITILGGVFDGTERRAFSARDDGALLAREIRRTGVRLLIVDPIISALGSFDSHRNAETRIALQPLADLAAETGVAILGIAHFAKGTAGRDPLERVSGSLAFGALSRVVMGAATKRNRDGEEQRLFVRVKSNIGPDSGGFTYGLEQTQAAPEVFASRVLWGDAVEGSARELLAESDGGEDGDSPQALERFIRSMLDGGPITATEFRRDAEGAGYQWHTTQRLAKKLGAESRKTDMRGPWRWGFYDRPKATNPHEGDEGNTLRVLSPSSSSESSVTPSWAPGPAGVTADDTEVV